MTSALTFVSEAAAEHHGPELPFADFWFGVIALALFLLLLAVTWSFRNTAAKVVERNRTAQGHGDATAPHEPGRVL